MIRVTVMTVKANQIWQSTGVMVGPQDRVVVMWLSGEWSANPQWGYLVNARGDSTRLAKPGYALPGAPEAALVGLIQGQNNAFLIGNRGGTPSGQNGVLYLATNDDVNKRYGPGYPDNIGSIRVAIVNENSAF